MSDRTNVTVTIYACADGEESLILDILRDSGVSLDWCDPVGDSIDFGSAYGANEASMTEADDIARALIDDAPGCTFEVYTDPAYEYLGTVVKHTPDLGRFDADCDANGVVLLTPTYVLSLVRNGDETAADKALGLPWDREFSRLNDLRKGAA